MTRGTAGTVATVAVIVGALAVSGAAVTTAGAKKQPVAKRTVTADPHGNLKFDKKNLTAPAGKVKLVMHNPGSSGTQHGIAVKGHGLDKDGRIVNPGKTSSVTVTLKPGTYSFYCPVLGHRAAGMNGHITVK
jgi:uncharacterized cupredoxin-like copper-binding protein